jgi:hypothetical protein
MSSTFSTISTAYWRAAGEVLEEGGREGGREGEREGGREECERTHGPGGSTGKRERKEAEVAGERGRED